MTRRKPVASVMFYRFSFLFRGQVNIKANRSLSNSWAFVDCFQINSGTHRSFSRKATSVQRINRANCKISSQLVLIEEPPLLKSDILGWIVFSIWFSIIQQHFVRISCQHFTKPLRVKKYKVTLATQLASAAFVWSKRAALGAPVTHKSFPTWRAEKKPNRAISPRRDLIRVFSFSYQFCAHFTGPEANNRLFLTDSRSFNWGKQKMRAKISSITKFHPNNQAGKRMQQVSC